MGSQIESVQRYGGNHFPDYDRFVRGTLSLFLNGDVDAREGSATDGVMIGAFTLVSPDFALLDDGGTFSDDTTDFTDAGTADVALMPATEAVNDAFYIGDAAKFSGIKITLSTAGVGTAVVYEYYNTKGAWVNLATAHNLQDDSTGLTAGTSTYFITWELPSDWASTEVGDENASGTGYFVRIRVTTASFTTVPVATQGWVLGVKSGVGVNFPSEGIVTGASWTADTVSGSTDDTILQIVNLDKGTATTVTLTKATKAGYADVDAVNGLAFAKGDTLLIQCIKGDATEVADVNLVLEFKQ